MGMGRSLIVRIAAILRYRFFRKPRWNKGRSMRSALRSSRQIPRERPISIFRGRCWRGAIVAAIAAQKIAFQVDFVRHFAMHGFYVSALAELPSARPRCCLGSGVCDGYALQKVGSEECNSLRGANRHDFFAGRWRLERNGRGASQAPLPFYQRARLWRLRGSDESNCGRARFCGARFSLAALQPAVARST